MDVDAVHVRHLALQQPRHQPTVLATLGPKVVGHARARQRLDALVEETCCVLGDNVYLMHDVTLGATGNSPDHDRHPKIGNGVFLGAKCTVLGNVKVGDGATVAAAALVNKPVPPGYTAVGVPARLIEPKPTKATQEDFKRAAK